MKAWILEELHKPLRLVHKDIPTSGEVQVVIKVRATGLCHSDVGFMARSP